MDEASNDAPAIVPVIEEELEAGRRKVKTGAVRVRKTVEHIPHKVEMPVVRDAVRVTRVPVGRPVDAMPSMREEGDTLIIPVVEEEIVVQKRLVLKEEIRIERRRTRTRVSEHVDVAREHAVVERMDAEGNVTRRSDLSEPPEDRRVLSAPHKSIVK
jgi:uncharacterized protein (TIGR02271 family)